MRPDVYLEYVKDMYSFQTYLLLEKMFQRKAIRNSKSPITFAKGGSSLFIFSNDKSVFTLDFKENKNINCIEVVDKETRNKSNVKVNNDNYIDVLEKMML